MKSTKRKKKLALNKKTIASLNNSTLTNVKGGAEWTVGCTGACHSVLTLCECGATDETECTCPRCHACITEYPPHCDQTIFQSCEVPCNSDRTSVLFPFAVLFCWPTDCVKY